MQAQLDPHEIAARIGNAYPDIDPAAVLRKPLIIVSAPRSGSNLLFEQLSNIPGFWTIGGESHVIFRMFPHLRVENPQFDSGSLGEEHADDGTVRLLQNCFLYFLRDAQGHAYLAPQNKSRQDNLCLLEKTPRNALNIPFLLKLFPEARFVYLYREPRQTIASLIEAWTVGLQSGRFKTFQHLPDWDRPGWCFLLPPGWRDMRGKSIAEIAAFQWSASNRIIVDALATLPANRYSTVSYHDLVENPQTALQRICKLAGIEAEHLRIQSADLVLSRTTLTPPHVDKWKKYEQAIEALMPTVSPIEKHIEKFVAAARIVEH